MKNKKIALVGSGNIGSTIAHLILLKRLGDVVLFDIIEELAQGKALDLAQCCPIENVDISIIGTSDYSDITHADIVIVTAGLSRKPGMSRDNLLEINANIMKTVGIGIKKYCPNAFVICVTNPLDVMVSVLQQFSGLSDNKIVGMAGMLDSARFRTFLAWELKVSVSQVQAYVLGGHGDLMVPLTQFTNINGISINDLIKKGIITQKKIDEIIERTRQGGSEIVSLLKYSSAFYAPAESVITMIEAYILDKKSIIPCATKLRPYQYGVKQPLFIGVPAKIGSNGIEEIIELNLSSSETKQLQKSISKVIELNHLVEKFLK